MTAATVDRQGAVELEPERRLEQHHVDALDLVAEGLLNHEIARRLGIKPDSVADRLKTAAKILGTGERTQMVAECYRRGIFERKPTDGEVPEVAAHLMPLLSLLARGTSYAECAKALRIDEALVKRRAPTLYKALGAVDRAALPRRAVDSGLLPPSLMLTEPEPIVPKPACPLLSADQLRVLRLLAFGMQTRAVATRLAVSEGSVLTTVQEAMKALGARSLPHAVLLACQAGILPGGAS